MEACTHWVLVAPESAHLFKGWGGRCSNCNHIVITVKAYIDLDGVCRLAERNLAPQYGTRLVAAAAVPIARFYPDGAFPHVCYQIPTSGEYSVPLS